MLMEQKTNGHISLSLYIYIYTYIYLYLYINMLSDHLSGAGNFVNWRAKKQKGAAGGYRSRSRQEGPDRMRAAGGVGRV